MEDFSHLKIKQLKHEAGTLKRMLGFMQEENNHLKNRLADVLKEHFDQKMLDDMEVFQNNFIKEDEVIKLFKNDLAEIQNSLLTDIITDGMIHKQIESNIQKLRLNMDTAEKTLLQLIINLMPIYLKTYNTMIIRNSIKNTFLVVMCFYTHSLYAQLNAESINSALAHELYFSFTDSKQWKQIQSFYASNNFHPAWLNKEKIVNRNKLFYDINNSAAVGLKEKDYQYDLIKSLQNGTAQLITTADSLKAELQITEAALHFYNDMAYGNISPQITYKGISDMPQCYDVPSLLQQNLAKNDLPSLHKIFTSNLPEIKVLQTFIQKITGIINNIAFKEIVITSDSVSSVNKPLLIKLYQLGLIEDANQIIADTVVLQKVKMAQKQFGQFEDGKLGKNTTAVLNVTLYERLQALNFSINYYRWLSCFSQNKSVIVVNIPAAYLKVYAKQKIVLEMKVIVGKKSTPTPTLLSTVSEVVLYPYWHVPYSIATKELLPKLKRSAAVIDAGNYQVLNSAGNIVEPYSVNWKALSTKYFPYTIRQSTGCDNALGLLKLNFNSPAGVYLHDTPNKNAFSLNKRFLSHGCIRMENPTALGYLVLKNNEIAIDTLTQKGCLLNQSPIFVKATEAMPVMVWYNPVGIDAAGTILFFEDVYGKFNWKRKD